MVAMLNTAQVLEGRVKSLKQLTHVEVTSNKQNHEAVLLKANLGIMFAC